ncbi:zinc finger protein 395b isoform X5 [Anarrhichthys ocellatus]|uniref:zinc finger protein 395b isoform X5 n=1 Tax=Anarrhichthys ocellatus TaxID=433405 RepID=UPI0012EE5E48|nr:zinc finger protein 395-like isoform X5 [Anarrhichthys ocellatus]
MGPEDRAGAGPGGTAVSPEGTQARASVTTRGGGPDTQRTLVDTQWCAQVEKAFAESRHRKNTTSVQLPQREAERGWSNRAASSQAAAPTMHLSNGPASREAPYCFRSPGSVEMDEIMAAMVLTSLSCSPVVQGPPQTDPGPGLSHLIPTHSLASVQLFTLSNKASVTDDFINAGSSSSADMECGGGELSDSGSSGYWSWDHGNVSPAPSPSVTEMDSSPDEGLQMELEQGEELNAKKPKSSFRGVYRCLWPSCGKVLTSSVGMKRHIRVLHLGSRSLQLTDPGPTPAPGPARAGPVRSASRPPAASGRSTQSISIRPVALSRYLGPPEALAARVGPPPPPSLATVTLRWSNLAVGLSVSGNSGSNRTGCSQ